MRADTKSYVTKYGRKIEYWPRFLESHKRANPAPGGYLEFNKKGPSPDLRVGFHSFLYDYFTYTMSIEYLESLGFGGPFGRALDIGGREATVAKLLKAEGRAQWAACAEIFDFSRMLPEELFLKFFMQLKGFGALRKNLPAMDGQLLTTHVDNFGFYPSAHSLFWNYELRDQPIFDDYILEDIYKHEGRYDLITAFLCLDYFDPRELFVKVDRLLEPGGVFYFIYRYWWYPVNATLIVGEFPYACQRLEFDDLFRYFAERLPGRGQDMRTLYDYYHRGRVQPTLDDLVDIAEFSGLELLGARKLSPFTDNDSSTPYTPKRLQAERDTVFAEVLKDIRCFRQDVRLADLKAKYVMAAFTK